MAVGWSKDGAVQDQIDASVADALSAVRRRIPTGESAEYCEECGEAIAAARRRAVPGVRLCVTCQEQVDRKTRGASGYNRRGSKDSQLR